MSGACPEMFGTLFGTRLRSERLDCSERSEHVRNIRNNVRKQHCLNVMHRTGLTGSPNSSQGQCGRILHGAWSMEHCIAESSLIVGGGRTAPKESTRGPFKSAGSPGCTVVRAMLGRRLAYNDTDWLSHSASSAYSLKKYMLQHMMEPASPDKLISCCIFHISSLLQIILYHL